MEEVIDRVVETQTNKETIGNGMILASSNDRFWGHLIDVVCVFPIFITYIILMEKYFGVIKEGEFFRQPIGITGYILILFGFETIFSKTPGKFARKTMVVDKDGNKPSVTVFFVRNICRLIPFDAFTYFGNKRGWHDLLSKTYVVYIK